MPLVKIDTYLLQRPFDAGEELLENVAVNAAPPTYPMLVRVRDGATWQPPQGFEVDAQIGNIVSGRGDFESLRRLDEDREVLGVEASRPGGIAECGVSVPFTKATAVHAPPLNEQGDRALVAVIDGGIDVLHEAFRDAAGDPRIVEIWDQFDPTGPTPSAVHPGLKLNYGTVHREADIRAYVSPGPVPAALGPGAGPADARSHGTHVTSIAAGRAAGTFAGGVAPAAKIVFVKAKRSVAAGDPASIGYSKSHIDALVYIKAVAQARGLPVAVNVSLGQNAGAHDGNSPLEVGFDAFSDGGRLPGVAVVKSAGNERRHDGHARLTFLPNRSDTLEWESRDVPRTEDLVELWFRASDELKLTLVDPHGERSPTVADWSTPAASGAFTSGNTYALSYTRYHHDNGDSRVLLTIRQGTAPRIEPGIWQLEIVAGRVRPKCEVHAWLERNDSRPIRFTHHQDDEMTLSIPGTARSVITVGAVDSQFPTRNHTNSSYGPTRDGREKPDVVAPGTEIEAAKAGTVNGTVPLSGTSMAAPHVTGAIALLFSRHAKQPQGVLPNANQIRAALTQSTQNGIGQYIRSDGYGLLDIAALNAAFD